MTDEREIQELMQKGLKELQSMKVRTASASEEPFGDVRRDEERSMVERKADTLCRGKQL